MKGRRFVSIVAFILVFLLGTVFSHTYAVKIGIVYNEAQWRALQGGKDHLIKYRKAIKAAGGDILSFSVTDPDKVVDEKLRVIDGILIPGGDDVDPQFYGEQRDEKLEATDIALDKLEMKILDFCVKNRIPILGICRGEQILNVFMGGSLYQDIPTRYKTEKKVTHRIRKDGVSQPCFHEINIEKDSKLYELMKKDRIMVNSYHHQGIKKLGKGLKITARSDDGFVEAVEGTGDLFILALQFHPEKLRIGHPEFDALFKAFIQAAAERREKARVSPG